MQAHLDILDRSSPSASPTCEDNAVVNHYRYTRVATLFLILTMSLTGCGLVALPFRVTSAVVKTVPVAGHVAAAPLDATADVID